LYITTVNSTDNAVASMNTDGGDVEIVFDDGTNNWAATFSPDGRYIIFTRYDGVSDQLYLMTSDGTTYQQLTTDGGNSATWYEG
jgi:Tol biopolymer transport system component